MTNFNHFTVWLNLNKDFFNKKWNLFFLYFLPQQKEIQEAFYLLHIQSKWPLPNLHQLHFQHDIHKENRLFPLWWAQSWGSRDHSIRLRYNEIEYSKVSCHFFSNLLKANITRNLKWRPYDNNLIHYLRTTPSRTKKCGNSTNFHRTACRSLNNCRRIYVK